MQTGVCIILFLKRITRLNARKTVGDSLSIA